MVLEVLHLPSLVLVAAVMAVIFEVKMRSILLTW